MNKKMGPGYDYQVLFRRLRWMAENEAEMHDPYMSSCKAWSKTAMRSRGVDIEKW
ncbi:hypothetical protein HK098_002375 [Nowakowskiella sp. JEL0407]|nr:hypothetical protein HK098_002375 [Nowakowskiella sp. JEL0407]